MVQLIRDNRGNILYTAMIVLLGVLLGMAVYGTFHGAEAVVGGVGNLTDSNNPHNFSASSSGVAASSDVRICVFCHTSHGAKKDLDLIDPPLWNHSLSSATYNVLTPGTIVNSLDPLSKYNPISPANAGVVNMLSSPGAPDGASRLCLGCHDGTIGIGNVGSESVAIAMNTASSCVTSDGRISSSCSAYIGNDLTQKHVVSIPMNEALKSASAANCGVAGQTTKLQYPWEGGQQDTVLLRPTLYKFGGTVPGIDGNDAPPASRYMAGYKYGVQCSTCHDPHLWNATQGNEGYKFLVTSGFDALCTACHTNCQ